MLTRENYRGLFAYPPTPFTVDLALDEDALRSNLRKLIRVGVDGIVLAGTSGEFYTLEADEYRTMARILREETAGKEVASVIGAIGLCTRETIRQARVASDEGIDAVLVVQPFYLQLAPAELLKFWNDLCLSCPDVGVIIYHYDWIRQPYSVDIFKALSHLPNLLGSKEAHWDFALWEKFNRESDLVRMSSTDAGWLVEMYRCGAVGVGSLQVSMMPHVVRTVLDHCTGKNFETAARALAPLTELTACLKLGHGRPHVFPSELEGWREYSPQARHKALIDAFGFLHAGPPREPNIPVPNKLQDQLARYIRRQYPALVPPADYASQAPTTRMWPRARTESE